MIVVADTSPPLHLARIGRLDLIPAVVAQLRADGFWLSDDLVTEFLHGLGETL
jgi:predicted nucleic acid-binding protein